LLKRIDAIKSECLLNLIRSRRDGIALHNDAFVMSDQQKITVRTSDKRRDKKISTSPVFTILGPVKIILGDYHK
jgi:hypothetical protein